MGDGGVPSLIEPVGIKELGQEWMGQSFYKTFVEKSALAMGIVRPTEHDMQNVYVNETAAKFFGIPASEVRNKFSSKDLQAPQECVENWLDNYRKSVEQGSPSSLEYTSKCTAESGQHWSCATMYPIGADQKNHPLFGWVAHDVTEKKLLEFQLEQWKQKVETLLNNVECVVFELSPITGEFTFISNQLENILGYSPSACKQFASFFSDNIVSEDKHLVPTLKDILEARKMEVILRFYTQNRSTAWIKTRFTVSADTTVIYGVIFDVTETRRMAEMQRQQEELRRKMKVKSEFLAEISHELRTPLNGIIGMANLILDSQLTSVQQDQLAAIQSSGESLLSIVNNILDFAKVEEGKMELENIPFNLRDVIEDACELLSVQADEKNLELIVRYPTNVADGFLGDPTRFRQVILNLAGNALKFTTKGYVMVEVQYQDGQVHVSVTDTGIGIADEKLKLIFHRFEQANGTVSRVYGGSGLGLHITKHLVALMNGTIGVQSVEGKGSTFWFKVPLSQHFASSKNVSVRIDEHKIMVVHPNPKLNEVISEQLVLWNFQVKSCSSWDEAIHELQTSSQSSSSSSSACDLFIAGNSETPPLNQLPSHVPIAIVSRITGRTVSESGRSIYALFKPVTLSRLRNCLAAIFHDKELLKQGVKRKRPTTNTPLSIAPQVLVVDDNRINQKIAASMLERLGCRVQVAENGKVAVEKFRNAIHACDQPYSVIFMDLQMPVCDGYEATNEIRRIEREQRLSPTAIIALTASVIQEDKWKSHEMQGCFLKPIRGEDLLEALHQFVTRGSEKL